MLEGGEKWGKHAGKTGEKGVKLFGITGDAPHPMIIESPIGTPLNQLIEESKAENIVAAEVGGSTERILLKEELTKPLGFKPGQTANGVGSIVLFNQTRNLKHIYEQKMEFMAEESC